MATSLIMIKFESFFGRFQKDHKIFDFRGFDWVFVMQSIEFGVFSNKRVSFCGSYGDFANHRDESIYFTIFLEFRFEVLILVWTSLVILSRRKLRGCIQ